jgi:predicted hydrocarbon binding protein
MVATVDALLPLSLLEAMRTVDTPIWEEDAEYVGELRSKRLGLSDTVYAQIRRYTEAARRRERLPLEEATGIARLVGRRPDAEQVFRDGGELLAERTYNRIPALARWTIRFSPSIISRPMAFRHARRVARRYYNGSVERVGSFVILSVPESATVGTAPGNAGCAYYASALGGLLGRLLHGGGQIEHVRCAERGDGPCQWRADWRARR